LFFARRRKYARQRNTWTRVASQYGADSPAGRGKGGKEKKKKKKKTKKEK